VPSETSLSLEDDDPQAQASAQLIARVLKGFGKGAWDSNVATPLGLASHPVQSATGVKAGLGQLVQHPIDTLKAGAQNVWQGLTSSPESFGATVGGFIGPGDYAKGLKALEMTGEASRGINAISHTIEDGEHVVQSPNGVTYAQTASNGRDVKVLRSDTSAEAAGRGEGTDRLQSLADTAHAQGGVLQSDVSVSPGAARTYEKLGERGYNVQKNPGASINPDTGNWISDDPRESVFTVHPAEAESPPE
jgi:hypothetical protein